MIIASAGASVISFISNCGSIVILVLKSIVYFFRKPIYINRFLLYFGDVVILSAGVASIASFCIGMVIVIHGYEAIPYNPTYIPEMLAESILTEMGPILTGVMCAGRISAPMASEIANMRSTRQIDAMQMLHINPIKFIISPRLLACTLGLPILSIFACVAGLLGGYVIWRYSLYKPSDYFILSVLRCVTFFKVKQIIIKTAIFGMIISGVGAYSGYYMDSHRTISSVGASAMVKSSLTILLVNYLIVILMK